MPLPSDPQAALGLAVRQLRLEAGMTQEDLAYKSRMTTAALSRIEVGKRNPTWSTVKRIARGLDKSLADIAALSEELDAKKAKTPPVK